MQDPCDRIDPWAIESGRVEGSWIQHCGTGEHDRSSFFHDVEQIEIQLGAQLGEGRWEGTVLADGAAHSAIFDDFGYMYLGEAGETLQDERYGTKIQILRYYCLPPLNSDSLVFFFPGIETGACYARR